MAKAAIVTGASRGIGAAIALRLARDGFAVLVNYRLRSDAAEVVVASIREAGGIASSFRADVADPSDAEALIAECVSQYGAVEVLVNNAGLAEMLPLADSDAEHAERLFRTNVLGVINTTRAALQYLGSGASVINITSGAAAAAPPGAGVYAATKSAVQTLSASWSAELGAIGVRVNCVAPGVTHSDMASSVFSADALEAVRARTALGRIGEPEDIASVVSFLASADSHWVTGQVIGASGGLR